jgi:uncharacterized membrane protein (UPF0127 family)
MRYEVFIGIIVIICLGFIFAYNIFGNKQQQDRVCFKDRCFTVSLALTLDEQSKGLMFVEHLDEDKGMLFVFQKDDIYSFWMKNTLIPLDIIWIDSNDNVVYISQNAQPCKSVICESINPEKQARYVLEINAGIADRIGLAVGDKMMIEYMKT